MARRAAPDYLALVNELTSLQQACPSGGRLWHAAARLRGIAAGLALGQVDTIADPLERISRTVVLARDAGEDWPAIVGAVNRAGGRPE